MELKFDIWKDCRDLLAPPSNIDAKKWGASYKKLVPKLKRPNDSLKNFAKIYL